jgi:hypothetical protein
VHSFFDDNKNKVLILILLLIFVVVLGFLKSSKALSNDEVYVGVKKAPASFVNTYLNDLLLSGVFTEGNTILQFHTTNFWGMNKDDNNKGTVMVPIIYVNSQNGSRYTIYADSKEIVTDEYVIDEIYSKLRQDYPNNVNIQHGIILLGDSSMGANWLFSQKNGYAWFMGKNPTYDWAFSSHEISYKNINYNIIYPTEGAMYYSSTYQNCTYAFSEEYYQKLNETVTNLMFFFREKNMLNGKVQEQLLLLHNAGLNFKDQSFLLNYKILKALKDLDFNNEKTAEAIEKLNKDEEIRAAEKEYKDQKRHDELMDTNSDVDISQSFKNNSELDNFGNSYLSSIFKIFNNLFGFLKIKKTFDVNGSDYVLNNYLDIPNISINNGRFFVNTLRGNDKYFVFFNNLPDYYFYSIGYIKAPNNTFSEQYFLDNFVTLFEIPVFLVYMISFITNGAVLFFIIKSILYFINKVKSGYLISENDKGVEGVI